MDTIEKQFSGYMQQAGSSQGIKDNLLLEIFSILLIEPKEISLEDLAKKTGYSLASISNKIKKIEAMGLTSMGFVKKTSKPGTKKIFIYIDKNFIDMWKKIMISKQEGVIKNAKNLLPSIIEEGKKDKKTKEKALMIEDYYNQILKFEKILKEVLENFEKIKR